MIFEMNNLKWKIKEATADEVKKIFNDDNEDSYYFGSFTKSEQVILINKEVSIEKQREALYHELMHCYLYCYITNNIGDLDEETFCDISAKSHDIIHKIVEDYFNTIEIRNTSIPIDSNELRKILKQKEKLKLNK